MNILNHIEKFNQLASHYDTPINRQMAQLAVEAIRRLKDENNTRTAADLGCGTGLIGVDLLDDFDSMLFVDGSKNMLKAVETKLSQRGATNASVLQSDMENDLQLPRKVDTLILSLVLHHIANHQELLSKLYNNLNDNGQLFIIEMEKQDHNHHGIDCSELATNLSAIGFRNIQSESIYDAAKENDHYHASRFIISARK